MFKTTFENFRGLDILNAILMFVGGIVLLAGYASLTSLSSIHQDSGNVPVVKWIFLAGSIICFVHLVFYVFSVVNWFALRTKKKFGIIAELIYILGIHSDGKKAEDLEEEKKSIGEEVFKPKSESSPGSVESVYGFGHNEDQKWTFSGKKPQSPNKTV